MRLQGKVAVVDFDVGRAFYRETLGFEETFVDWQERWARQLDREERNA